MLKNIINMTKKDKINIKLFEIETELINNLEDTLKYCVTQLEMIKQFPKQFKNKQKLLKQEIDKTHQNIKTSNREISIILEQISIEGLDEIIKKSKVENINNLLDFRNKKSQ